MADILSNSLYHGRDYDGKRLELPQLLNHPKRVQIHESTLLRMIRAERKK